MVKNRKILEEFEREFIRKHAPDYEENLRIFSMLLQFAKEMGKIPPEDPLEGIEKDIKLARAINGVKESVKKTR